jgi:hypothetical protein
MSLEPSPLDLRELLEFNLLPGGCGHQLNAITLLSTVLPETWVTLYSEDMGNSFAPNGLSSGSSLHSVSSKYPKS